MKFGDNMAAVADLVRRRGHEALNHVRLDIFIPNIEALEQMGEEARDDHLNSFFDANQEASVTWFEKYGTAIFILIGILAILGLTHR